MKILVVTQYFWPETFRINELVEVLEHLGNDVTVLTGIPNYPTGKIFPEYKNNSSSYKQFNRTEVKRVPMLPRGDGALRLGLNYVSFAISATIFGPWLLRKKNFDIIFTYEPSPISVGIPAILLRRIKRAKTCLWILDLWPETPAALGLLKNRLLYRTTEYIVKHIYKNTDLLLIQSPGFISSVEKYAPKNSRIEYFPSWADSIFDSTTSIPAVEIQRDQTVFTILFAGNVGEAQDFESILKAVELLNGRVKVKIFILGDGRHSRWVEKEIGKRGLSENVVLLGRFPIERMPDFFHHADALLVTLKSDPVFAVTIPAKVQAYMAAGIPILAMLDGEGANAIRRWNCGIVANSGDSEGLAKAIIELSTATPEERKKMGANGRRGADSEFNREKLVHELVVWMTELQS